jgi:5-methylcytosine-specific restriction protein A
MTTCAHVRLRPHSSASSRVVGRACQIGVQVFDPAITTSATRGYYIVYLFHAEQPVVQLSLNQGTTAVREEFTNKARAVLADRAELMPKRVSEFAQSLPVITIELGSDARLPGDYVAGHALGTTLHPCRFAR